MASRNSLLKKLRNDFPEITFVSSDNFRWSPRQNTLYYPETMATGDEKILLHELAHALLGHADYDQDIELIHKERAAWEHASQKLSERYDVLINEDDIEEAMNSYRDWLHRRSLCPECSMSSLQQPKNTYKCLACGCSWRANDARICELRRYKLKTT